MNAIRIGYQALIDPESLNGGGGWTRESRADAYSQAWMYYRQMMFSRRDGANWDAYLAARQLYKNTRLIYNPVPQIIDFYVDNLWQAARKEEIRSLVCDIAAGAPEEILQAVAQIDQWTNWLAESAKAKRYAAVTGNVLIEIIDDLTRGKITQKIIWAGFVTELELSDSGDVRSYTIEYDVFDPAAKKNFRYKKQVTREFFRYFRDGKPFAPEGKTSEEEENPYGFCPAVWLKHTDDGADSGVAAFTHFDKIDEVNSFASHAHDFGHKDIESPKLIFTEDGKIEAVIGGQKNKDGTITPADPRLNWVVLMAKGSGSVHDLSGNLKLVEAHPYLKEMLASFSDDYPELQAHSIIKANSQLSGAALERMLTPAQNRLDRAAANYNMQLVKLRQMQLAVAGWRCKNGWRNLTPQQQKFMPFDLQSYERGDLDFHLNPSYLIQTSDGEREDLLKKKADRANALTGIVNQKERLIVAGYSDERADEILIELAKEDAALGDLNDGGGNNDPNGGNGGV